MKRIFFLLLVCVSTHVYAQTPALIAHYLGEAKKMTKTTDELKPLVLVDDTPYMGSIAGFKAAEITSIRIFDPITAHALFQAAGVHGAIVMTTKYRRSVSLDDNSQASDNTGVVSSKRLFRSWRSVKSEKMVTANPLVGNDQLDHILAKLGPGYRSFIKYHKGNNNITYMFNGAPMRGSRSAIALTMSGIPVSNIKFVKTKKITNAHGLGAIVYIRTFK